MTENNEKEHPFRLTVQLPIVYRLAIVVYA